MSFAVTYAGLQPAVAEKLAVDPHPNLQYGGELGKLTQEYLAKVAALAGPERSLIVESSGHGDGGTVQVNVRVLTVS